MKIAVIGTINKDLILPFQSSTIQSIGGIYYTVSTLSILGGETFSIIPVSFLGNDLYQAFKAILKNHVNVIDSGLIPIDQLNHKVILEYLSKEERTEKALFNFPPLEYSHFENLGDVDFYIVNLITGWDITLEAFLKLSENHFEVMYLDVHFLAMGIDKFGKRFPRKPANIEKWLKGARFVQMNQREFQTIAGEEAHENSFFEKYFNEEQVLIITKAGKGSNIIFYKENIIRNKHFPAFELDDIVDATGCGDVFGAGFVLRYLLEKNLYQAMHLATKAAAANCLIRGTNDMENLLPLTLEFEDNGPLF